MVKGFRKIILIYILAVFFYGLYISFFSIPVHLGVDEELYISMAKSFHYEGIFSKNKEVLNYSCVLYSILLSVAYFFYSPENIMFNLRMIGVIVMLSSVFPIYFLSSSILGDEKKATRIVLLACIFPSMMNTAYCMQEVLSYPLFLWLCYVVYKEIEKDKMSCISIETVIVVILSIVCYFTKTYMIFLPISYCLLVCLDSKKKMGILIPWKKIIFVLLEWIILYVVFERMILSINNNIEGVNHYSNQFSKLFPITLDTVISAISCMSLYFVALVFYWGILPIVLPIVHWKKYKFEDLEFLIFIISSFVILVVEIVISIVLTEEGNVVFPHKVLYRYFQVLEIPILVMFIKMFKEYRIPKWIWSVYFVVLGYMGVYYIYIGDNQNTAIIDAPLFLLMENINRYIFPHFNILACVFLILMVICVGVISRFIKGVDIKRGFVKLSLICIILFFIVNIFQLPLYTNIIAKGKMIEADAIKIANYYKENKEKYEDVYIVEPKSGGYEKAIYAYFPVEVCHLEAAEMIEHEEGNVLFICPKEYEITSEYSLVDLQTELFLVIEKSINNCR